MTPGDETTAELEHLKQQQLMILRAVRISLALLLLTVAVTCVRAELRLPTFSNLFRDLMPGTALPLATRMVLGHAGHFMVATLLLAGSGLGMLFFCRPGFGVVAGTIVIVVLFAQWQILLWAMQSPLFHLLHQIAHSPQ